MSNLTYPERLKKLKLPTLMYRRLRGDLIEVYKIMKTIYDSTVRPVLTKQKDVATYTGLRGYTTNLYPRLGQKAIRKQSFSIRVVEHWNSLPIEVQTCDTVNCFKNRIDEIYISKDILQLPTPMKLIVSEDPFNSTTRVVSLSCNIQSHSNEE